MKKTIYILLVSITCLVIMFKLTKFDLNKKTITTQNLRVIVNFDKSVFSSDKLNTSVTELHSCKVQELLNKFSASMLQAVFKNRYDKNGKLKPSIGQFNNGWQQILLKDKSKSEEFVNLLKKERGILNAYVEYPIQIKPCVAPKDPFYYAQWHLNSSPIADIRAEQAWEINKGRSDVIIAVCDGGVDYTHPDLDPGDRSRVIAGYDSGDDDNDPMDDLPDASNLSFAGHGTHVAGIIGAITNNNKQVAGIMWNCKIMPVKMVGSGAIRNPFGGTIIDFSTTALPSDVADAIDYAVNNGARVINLSYGFSGMGFLINELVLRIPLLVSTISNAYDHNVVIVAAMGNEFNDGNPIEYPAAFREVIAVGATNNIGTRWPDSNTGAHICVCAPGENIYSTIRGGGVDRKTGTSMATPVVSGVAGLIISQGLDRNFNLTNDDVRHILEKTADDISPAGFDNETGYGKVNAFKALSLLNTPNVLYHNVSTGGTSVKISSLDKWSYIGSKWGLASGMYLSVDQYQITKHITFDIPFCSVPQVWMRERESKCLSGANPNDGYQFSQITNISTTGFDVKYWAYYVNYNSAGQSINKWVPAEPSLTTIAYTAVGVPNLAATGSISGPTSSCDPTSTLTYSVSNFTSGATINWTSNNLTYVSGQGSNNYCVKVNGPGDGSVQATITANCGSFTLPALTIHNQGPSVSINGPTFIATGGTATYTANVNCGGSNLGYMWYLKDVTKGLPAIYLGTDYPLSLKAVAGSSSNVMIPNNPIGGGGHNYIITLTAGGTNGSASNTYAISCMASASIVANTLLLMSPASNMSLSPNPASDNVQVNIMKTQDAIINSDTTAMLSLQSNDSDIATYQVRIVNSFGIVFYSTKQTGENFTIPTGNLPNGTYIIEANDGKQSYRQQLIIKH